MKHIRIKSVMFVALCACPLPASWAGEYNKETHMTINVPLHIRDIVLAPGQYVFRLTDPDVERSVLSIFDAATNRLAGTVIGLPAYRAAAGDKRVFTVSSSHADHSANLQTWFYPGENYGLEFPLATKSIDAGSTIKPNQPTPDPALNSDGSSTH